MPEGSIVLPTYEQFQFQTKDQNDDPWSLEPWSCLVQFVRADGMTSENGVTVNKDYAGTGTNLVTIDTTDPEAAYMFENQPAGSVYRVLFFGDPIDGLEAQGVPIGAFVK